MGKSHRNVWAGSNSVDYHSPHNRGFAKKIKADSHRRIRTHNRHCNEDSIKTFNCKERKMNQHFASIYYDKLENVSNFEGHYLDDNYLNRIYGYKWNKNDNSLTDTINTIMDVNNDRYLIASKKQIERRGNIGRFYGHR